MMTSTDRSSRPARVFTLATLVTCLIALGFGVQPAAADTLTKVTILGGDQETPPLNVPARGCGRFVIDTVANTLKYHIVYGGLSSAETAAHIHGAADPGAIAGPLHTLPAGNPKVGTWNYPESEEGNILAGKMYVNIHTVANGGGEIRGQIVDMVALLNGAQETPAPIATPAKGYGLFNMDRCANTLSYYIGFAGLGSPETAAHIHGFSLHGVGSGALHPLPAGSPKVGAWTYPEAAEDRIRAGQTYVNIHTAVNGGGEIRGQITPTVVPLDGTQETPPLAVAGFGCGMVAIDPVSHTLSYYLEYGALTGPATAQHIHGFSGPGVSSGPLHTIALTNPVVGSWGFGAANLSGVTGGQTYFNVHTAANGSGEIRGQINFPAPPCSNDNNCDGTVDVNDLLALLANWGPCPAAPAPCSSDVNRDGVVDVNDLLALLAAWGPCP